MNRQLDFIPELEKKLRPLYRKMYSEIKNIDDYWIFCATWGKYFPSTKKNGILFYGRSNNGWIDYSEYSGNADAVFSFLFNRDDQVEWMPHNTRRAFVNLIKQISEEYYPEEWNQHIAWSNICKVAPDEGIGTPSAKLWHEQYQHMVDIMDVELRVMSPKIVVLITGMTAGERWDSPLFEIERYKDLKPTESIEWGKDNYGNPCTAKAGKKDGTIFIITDRPERRPIAPHAKAILNLIERLSS
ncbi:MAG: hypothetical protein KA955_08935 [Prevotella sp.]|nr:hypothetical protein [Prevotella sp.]